MVCTKRYLPQSVILLVITIISVTIPLLIQGLQQECAKLLCTFQWRHLNCKLHCAVVVCLCRVETSTVVVWHPLLWSMIKTLPSVNLLLWVSFVDPDLHSCLLFQPVSVSCIIRKLTLS